MALHPSFPSSPYEVLDPAVRWFPAAEEMRDTAYEKLLPPLVAKVRQEVQAWRASGYKGASESSKALLQWWFDTHHLIGQADGTQTEFRYYFAQREAVESVIWLHDVRKARDKYDLLRFDASGAVSSNMFDEEWPRFVVKMATGAGKTKVLSLLMAWSYFHKLYEPDSTLSRNFLLIAPNIIVLDRLRADFDGLRIFFNDPVLPDNGHAGRNWRDDFQIALHIQDDVRVVRPTGNLFLTNIHRVYLGEVPEPSLDDDDLRDYFLSPFGDTPVGKTTDSNTDLGELIREIDELAVFNDEAHHIHDPRMAWFKCIQDIHHRMLQKDLRLSIQIDVSATPKANNGAIFVQTISDYPLVEAIAQNVVKHPVLPDAVKVFIRDHLFDQAVDLESPVVLRNLSEAEVSKVIFDSFRTAINGLTIREAGTSRIEGTIKLRDTRPFRTQPRGFLQAKKSVFNRIVGEGSADGLELAFASFLEGADDVQAFGKNYMAVGFKIDYVKASGELSTYTPDFIVRTKDGAVWIVETKGREELDLPQKMRRLDQWCQDATEASKDEGGTRYGFVYVDQESFEQHKPTTFAGLVSAFREYQDQEQGA